MVTLTIENRVLLVDDDPSSRDSTAQFLEGEGFSVIKARDGTEALGHLTEGTSSSPQTA